MNKVFMNKRINTLFDAREWDYEDMRHLMTDTALGIQTEAKQEAEDRIRSFMLELFELTTETVTKKKNFRRAMRDHREEFFEVIEDTVADCLVQGWSSDPFFMQFVETRNIQDGDKNEFYTEQEVRLAVHRVAGDHHDFSVQRLGKGSKFSVGTVRYAAAVGADIRLYLLGRIDFTAMINAIYKAFDQKIKTDIYSEISSIGEKLPVSAMFNKAIPATSAGKEAFDQLVEDVAAANGNSSVFIIGSSMATKKLDKFRDVDWLSDDEKNEKYRSGRVGNYEGTPIIEVPQQLIRSGTTLNRLISADQLLVVPTNIDKFIKFVNEGDPYIYEYNERGDRMDDTMAFYYEQSFGVEVIIGKYFGNVKFTAGS